AGHVETGAHQLHGVEASTAGGVDHCSATVTFQYVDEEVAFAGRASVPIDQFIPALHEVVDIFVLVMIGFADFGWGFAEILFALKHCIDSDIATHAHIPPLRPSALVRAVILFKWNATHPKHGRRAIAKTNRSAIAGSGAMHDAVKQIRPRIR